MENTIPITEIFYSISGEGDRIGHPTVFIRVFGCNMNPVCPFCDTLYSVKKIDDTVVQYMPVEEIINHIIGYGCKDITFTGGEPLLYTSQIQNLMNILSLNGDYVFNFETNGMVFPDDLMLKWHNIHWAVSPKLHAIDLKANRYQAGTYVGKLRKWAILGPDTTIFKFVYENNETVQQIKRLEWLMDGFQKKSIYLMPEGKIFDQKKYDQCASACLQNEYIMSPRLHTIIWGAKRGV